MFPVTNFLAYFLLYFCDIECVKLQVTIKKGLKGVLTITVEVVSHFCNTELVVVYTNFGKKAAFSVKKNKACCGNIEHDKRHGSSYKCTEDKLTRFAQLLKSFSEDLRGRQNKTFPN